MDAGVFGNLIKQLREKKGMSQYDLSKGICSKEYIYKIEKGESIPSSYILEQLSVKLGEDLNIFLRLSKYNNPIKVLKIKKKVISLKELGKYEIIAKIIDKIMFNSDFQKEENLQFILYLKGVLAYEIEGNIDSAISLFSQALDITKKNYDYNNISSAFWNKQEIEILNGLGKLMYQSGDVEKAIDILKSLIYIIENKYMFIDNDIKLYCTLLYNLSKYYSKIKKNSKAFKCIDKAIDYAIKYNSSYLLGEMLYQKGLLVLETNRENGIELFENAIAIFEVYKEYENAQRIRIKWA